VNAFKRSLFGYRRSEVDRALAERDQALGTREQELAARDAALAALTAASAAQADELQAARARLAQLELVCDSLSDRVVARDAELKALRAELESALARAERLLAIAPQAREQATRMRLQALREVAELDARMRDLTAAPTHTRGRLAEAVRRAVERCGGDAEELDAMPERTNGHRPDRADAIFEGLVEVEVGPLDDFSQLVGFEDAAGSIGATSEISVRRFASGRATLEMKLAEPVELLRELEQRSPFDFRVRDHRFDRLVLDVD
jgi:multidrug efflux pump subunit AcrA (membrane-fusion protein)